jgi:hypothetical protein
MPRRSFPTATPGDAPARSPRQKGKRPAARKNTSKPARKRAKARTKPSEQVSIPPLLQLPAPLRAPLLTYAGDSHQIRSGATTIDMPRTIDGPSPPQPVDAIHQHDPATSGARVTAAPEAFTQSSRNPVPPRARRTYSVDPRVAAKIGLTGAIIGTVLLLARLTPVKPNDAIIRHDLAAAETTLVQDIGERSDAVLRTAMGERSDAVLRTTTQPPRPAHHPNFARMTRAKRSQHAGTHVRIIDAPARIKRSCGEQTWPYIADYCLTVAKRDASSAPKPSPAPPPFGAATGVDASPAQVVHVGDAAGSHATGDGIAERANYQTAALLDDAPVATENEKSETARRASEPRHDEPRRRYARSRQVSTDDERPARVRHASERRRYEERRHYARLRQRPEHRFAGGPPYAMQPYATQPSSFYAPWY